MSSPAERAVEVRKELGLHYGPHHTFAEAGAERDALIPPGSLVFHTRTEIVEWLRSDGLVVLDKQQAETVRQVAAASDPFNGGWSHQKKAEALAWLSAGEGPK